MPRSRPRITTVVFDLDDTLYDCYGQRVLRAHRYACQRMLAAGLERAVGHRLPLGRLVALRVRLFRAERNLDTLDLRLCARLGLRGRAAARLARVGRRAYFGCPVGRLHLFPDARPTLERLNALGVRLFILSAGQRAVQQAKVRRLGLDRLPYLRGHIFLTGLLRGRGKERYLRRVFALEPNRRRVLVVGDRPDSEIRAARELGLWTVQRRGGEFGRTKPRHRLERPHFVIRRLSRLFTLPFRFG